MSDQLQNGDRELEQLSREAVKFLDTYFNPGQEGPAREVGFFTVTFMVGRKAPCYFNSNGVQRRDVIEFMRVLIDRFEKDL